MTYAPQARTVAATAEFRRVLGLPKRDLTEADAQALVRDATEAFITPAGRRDGASLRPWQAAGLAEIYANRGAYLGYPVGQGKTLIGFQAPMVLEARRPVLCTPAGLRRQTLDDWARYSEHWRCPNPVPRILSYEELTDEPKVDLLDRIAPDLIICDEADTLRNIESSMVKRLDRYRRAHWNDCDYVCMTGTPGRLSIMDIWHLLIWCLRDKAPVPLDRSEAEVWALAIDEKASRFGARPSVGALLHLGGEGRTQVDKGRDGFRRRLTSTPGVVLLDADSCDQPLTIRQVMAPHDPVLEEHFARFRGDERCTPSGERISDPLSVYRHAGELGVGYYSVFDPPPPEPWKEARRNWHAFVDDVISRSNNTARPLDTEAAVARAFPEAWQLKAWREIKGTYTTPSKPVWCSDSVVEWVLDYAAAADAEGEPALVWSWSVPLCEALEWASRERARRDDSRPMVWFGRKGMSRAGQYIGKADATYSAILSGGANLRGRNLQAFRRNLFLAPPMSARYLEQALQNEEPVLTPSGWKPIGGLTIGDEVFGSDGTPCKVLDVLPQGERPLYKLTFSDGTEIVSTGDHLWETRLTLRSGTVKALVTTEEMRGKLRSGQGEYHFNIEPCQPIQYPEADLPVDPYTLGALLGDGSFTHECLSFTSMDQDIVDRLTHPGVSVVPIGAHSKAMTYRIVRSEPRTRTGIHACPHTHRRVRSRGMCGACANREMRSPEHRARRAQGIRRAPLTRGAANPLIQAMKRLGIWGLKDHKKRIPDLYMRGSVAQRLELLRGLLDTDGSAPDCPGGFDFTSTSSDLAMQVRELVESLGGIVRYRVQAKTLNGKVCKDQHRLYCSLPAELNPFFCKRKRDRFEKWARKRTVYRAVEKIEPAGVGLATCIRVSAPDSLFITRGHTLTHNCLGRTHRSGQGRDVHVDWLVTSYESAMGLERAVGEAAFGKQTWSTSQKLLRATIERIPPEAWPVATKRFATQPDICDIAA